MKQRGHESSLLLKNWCFLNYSRNDRHDEILSFVITVFKDARCLSSPGRVLWL
jgi:hypothetical protein